MRYALSMPRWEGAWGMYATSWGPPEPLWFWDLGYFDEYPEDEDDGMS
jgi:hypothetical protein